MSPENLIERARMEGRRVLDLSDQALTKLPDALWKLTNLTRLSLINNQLAQLPPEIVQLSSLTGLSLINNQLAQLPPEIVQLSNLTGLYLRNNQLKQLSPEIVQLSNLVTLDLRSNQLTQLSPKIVVLTKLTELSLDGNQLTQLPPEIAALTNLTKLSLSDNQLTQLPPEIAALTNLTELSLSGNQLTQLPSEIATLTKLATLDLRSNQLTQLPTEIAALTKLATLDLRSNQLTQLPTEIAALTKLATLDLRSNQLTQLPAEIGQLSNLTELSLSNNQLTQLPAEIGQLSNLTTLDLRSNQLTKLPAEIGQLSNLTTLVLKDNQLTRLPAEIGQLSNLTTLVLKNNQLPIPLEILEKHDAPTTIVNFYIEYLAGQKKSLNEAKLLIVGQGSVGKTSLMNRLLHNYFNPHENKTEGISIQPWQVEDIQLNVWDFGGQEIMHATHQFFLTKRSLYLLVLDTRLREEENRLDYWLKIIQSFGGNSPVIVIGNKSDQQALDLDRRGLQLKYSNIKAFVETSCQSGQGIDTLKAAITKEVSQLEHIKDELPLSWFDLKSQLEEMDRDYTPYPEYIQLCQKQGINNKQSQQTLIGFLHDLGVVLNFRDDPRLEDTNILNPRWVTNGVYQILNDNTLITEHKGILERSMLDRILDSRKYPHNKQLFIIDMMRKFELCFDLEPDKKFLIPDLLSKEEPDTGTWDNTLAFQYHYNVLPGSIISRFIVRSHQLISKNTYWRSGVVLTYEGSRALVKSDREDKKIFIWIDGSKATQRQLLGIIRSHFDHIHGTITGIEVAGKVPLPGRPDVVLDYQDLLVLESVGKSTHFIPSLRTEVNVKQLLEGVEPMRSQQQQDPDNRDFDRLARTPEKNINYFFQGDNTVVNTPALGNQDVFNTLVGVGTNEGKIGNITGVTKGDMIGTQNNYTSEKQDLATAATEIQQLLEQLSQKHPTTTTVEQMSVAAKAVEEIESKPKFKSRVVGALKAAGTKALKEAIDHPVVNVLVAAIEGWAEAE